MRGAEEAAEEWMAYGEKNQTERKRSTERGARDQGGVEERRRAAERRGRVWDGGADAGLGRGGW
jgi:hypothetical protein